jgi:hypothetical protein
VFEPPQDVVRHAGDDACQDAGGENDATLTPGVGVRFVLPQV